VPEPCHKNWDKMTNVEKGRFCGSCQKKVIDFTSMSDRELAAFFKKLPDSVCGRFLQDQLNRDIVIPKKRIPWAKYFFQITLPAFLISMKATSQSSRTQGKVFATCKKEIMGDTIIIDTVNDNPISNEISKIRGRIVDERGNGLSGATIVVKGTSEGAASDPLGNFILKMKKDTKPQILVASCLGHHSKEINFTEEYKNNKDNVMEIKMEEYVTGGLVVVRVGPVSIRKATHIPILNKIFKDSSFNNFRVYPNPAQVGSLLHFEFKKPVPGIYSIQLFTQTGQLIHGEEIELNEKNQLESIRVPSAIPGTYFIRMRNKKTGKEYPEKIIIQ
jgi:hypothetical protein